MFSSCFISFLNKFLFLIYTCSYFKSSGSKLPTFLSSSKVLKGLSTAPARYIDSNVNEGLDPGAIVSFILYTAIPDVLPIPTNTRRVSSSSSPMVKVSASGPWQKNKNKNKTKQNKTKQNKNKNTIFTDFQYLINETRKVQQKLGSAI